MNNQAIAEINSEFEARKRVNEFIPSFFDTMNKDEFIETQIKLSVVSRVGIRLKGILERHSAEIGSLPLLSIAMGVDLSEKEKQLRMQLRMHKFQSHLGGMVEIKIDSSQKFILNCFNLEGTQVLSMQSVIYRSKGAFGSYLDEDLELSWVDVNNSDLEVFGKKVAIGESLLGTMLENSLNFYYYTDDDIELHNKAPHIRHISELSAERVMLDILDSPMSKGIFRALMVESKDLAFQSSCQKEKNDELQMSF